MDERLEVTKTIPAEKLPPSIEEVPDDVLQWAITSERTKRPFKIIKQELAFYRTQGIPLPHLHPEERHADRVNRRPPRRLWEGKCSACAAAIQSTFAPDRPEKVLCEKCYLKEVY